jgi:hypothetical protein
VDGRRVRARGVRRAGRRRPVRRVRRLSRRPGGVRPRSGRAWTAAAGARVRRAGAGGVLASGGDRP